MIGKVVSTKMKNTVVVEVERFSTHPVYKKRLRRSSRFLAHDEIGTRVGDQVRIESIRPKSRNKYHQVVEVIAQESSEKKVKKVPSKADSGEEE
ncbi:MAG: 30S ribosomal protein S17 [Candidatus Woykebacteria bacterium RIFCSPHIGHO2_12_FULL_45_10]|uniref:30S ribosomal protein S17 n=1 Tax=Candidatus Woykebacteria bacterium RIFCSPHIGHO2_12_FULL_45_10 TaxID=1802603 RepID=A0A1G1WMK6_9BACT|nr:MAG: 30S ribosomal protein S17 [Candidatus Woykebacteria bacterium RIFCSPHIGHO2_12_FULL_45_10]